MIIRYSEPSTAMECIMRFIGVCISCCCRPAQHFGQHVKRNGAKCVGAVPVPMPYIKTLTGTLLEWL